MSRLVLVLFAVFLAYAVAGDVGLRLWRRHRPRPPANLHADPNAWLAYWSPLLIAVQVWALIGGGLTSLGLIITSLPQLRATLGLGFGLGIAVCLVFCATYDVVTVARARRAAHLH